MPSRMNVRAVWLRTPSQKVVWSGRANRSSNENVVGSDFTSQYRFYPGFRAKTQAHELSARNGPATFAGFFRFQATELRTLMERVALANLDRLGRAAA